MEREKQLQAKIINYREEKITLDGGRTQPKIVFTVKTAKNHEFDISVAEVETSEGPKFQGLWLNLNDKGKVAKNSTLNLLLQHFSASSLEDLKDKVVTIKPDKNDFFAIQAR